jgi:cellobiose transport system substrate-binding protein
MRRAARARWMVAAAALLALTGCTSTVVGTPRYAGPPPTHPPTVDPTKPVTLTFEIPGEIDADARRDATLYHQLHPNVTVRLLAVPSDAYWPRLQAQIAAGDNTSDIVQVTSDNLGQMRKASTLWADLAALGATGDDFFPAAWRPASLDGAQLALPVSMEPFAICYRKDLFARGGLPTDRDVLAGHWRTWQDYVNDGSLFAARVHDATYLDSSTSVFNAMVASGPGYYDTDGKPAIETEPSIRAAFELAVRGQQGTAMPREPEFASTWFSRLQGGRVATLPCFPGLLSLLNSGSGAGKWDLAPAPGAGSINTDYYAIPKTSKNTAAAYGFINWLTSTAEQRRAFTTGAFFPTRRSAATAPDVAAKTDRAVSNAPTGKIFGAAAARLTVTNPGANPSAVQQAFERVLGALPAHITADAAWQIAAGPAAAVAN